MSIRELNNDLIVTTFIETTNIYTIKKENMKLNLFSETGCDPGNWEFPLG